MSFITALFSSWECLCQYGSCLIPSHMLILDPEPGSSLSGLTDREQERRSKTAQVMEKWETGVKFEFFDGWAKRMRDVQENKNRDTVDIWAKFCGNPANSRWEISIWTKIKIKNKDRCLRAEETQQGSEEEEVRQNNTNHLLMWFLSRSNKTQTKGHVELLRRARINEGARNTDTPAT